MATMGPSPLTSPDLSCAVPGCRHPAITDDGPGTPCMPHVLMFGHAAAAPEILSDGEVLILLEAHGDVVKLETERRPYRQWWRWLLT